MKNSLRLAVITLTLALGSVAWSLAPTRVAEPMQSEFPDCGECYVVVALPNGTIQTAVYANGCSDANCKYFTLWTEGTPFGGPCVVYPNEVCAPLPASVCGVTTTVKVYCEDDNGMFWFVSQNELSNFAQCGGTASVAQPCPGGGAPLVTLTLSCENWALLLL